MHISEDWDFLVCVQMLTNKALDFLTGALLFTIQNTFEVKFNLMTLQLCI